jgi:hypothetical protein
MVLDMRNLSYSQVHDLSLLRMLYHERARGWLQSEFEWRTGARNAAQQHCMLQSSEHARILLGNMSCVLRLCVRLLVSANELMLNPY